MQDQKAENRANRRNLRRHRPLTRHNPELGIMTACGAVFGTGSRHDPCGGSRGEIRTTPLLRGRPFQRASKVRAAKSASRRGGFAARDSLRPYSDSPRPPMRKAGSLAADDSAAQSQVASPAVTSNAADVSAASGKSVSRVAESHDSATPEIAVKRSSSRWADRPVPVLQVEFPEPWSIVAHAASADAESGEIAGNLKWSRLLQDIRTWFEGHAGSVKR